MKTKKPENWKIEKIEKIIEFWADLHTEIINKLQTFRISLSNLQKRKQNKNPANNRSNSTRNPDSNRNQNNNP